MFKIISGVSCHHDLLISTNVHIYYITWVDWYCIEIFMAPIVLSDCNRRTELAFMFCGHKVVLSFVFWPSKMFTEMLVAETFCLVSHNFLFSCMPMYYICEQHWKCHSSGSAQTPVVIAPICRFSPFNWIDCFPWAKCQKSVSVANFDRFVL